MQFSNSKNLDNDAVYLASVIVKQATKKGPPAAVNGKDAKRKTIIKAMLLKFAFLIHFLGHEKGSAIWTTRKNIVNFD
jgi:hypothetical protein